MSNLRKEIAEVINRNSAEHWSDTPDFILAEYLGDCLNAYDKAVNAREKWYGRQPKMVPYYECPHENEEPKLNP